MGYLWQLGCRPRSLPQSAPSSGPGTPPLSGNASAGPLPASFLGCTRLLRPALWHLRLNPLCRNPGSFCFLPISHPPTACFSLSWSLQVCCLTQPRSAHCILSCFRSATHRGLSRVALLAEVCVYPATVPQQVPTARSKRPHPSPGCQLQRSSLPFKAPRGSPLLILTSDEGFPIHSLTCLMLVHFFFGLVK